MVKPILKAGTPVEFTLTGIKANVVAIQNDSVLFQNEKGEDIIHNFKTTEGMLKSGALKVLLSLCGVPVGYIREPAGTTTNPLSWGVRPPAALPPDGGVFQK